MMTTISQVSGSIYHLSSQLTFHISGEFFAAPGEEEEEEGSTPAYPTHMDTGEELEEMVRSITRRAASYNRSVRVSTGEEDIRADIGNAVVEAVSNVATAQSPSNGLWLVRVRVSCTGLHVEWSLTHV